MSYHFAIILILVMQLSNESSEKMSWHFAQDK